MSVCVGGGGESRGGGLEIGEGRVRGMSGGSSSRITQTNRYPNQARALFTVFLSVFPELAS